MVLKYELNKNTPKCQYNTKNGTCGRKCINSNTCKYHKFDKKEKLFSENILEKNKINLICYYNDYKEKRKIDNIIIKDNLLINNRSAPLLLCYNNDNLLFKEYLKKRLKKLKYKKRRKEKKILILK